MRALLLMGLLLTASTALAQSGAPAGGVDDTRNPNTSSDKAAVPAVPPSSAAQETRPGLALTEQQQNEVRKSLSLDPASPVDDARMSFAPGVQIPESVELHPLPSDLQTNVRSLDGKSFFVGRTHYFVVDGKTRVIAAIVAKNTGY